MRIEKYELSLYEDNMTIEELNEGKLKDAESLTLVPAPYNLDERGKPRYMIIYATFKNKEEQNENHR